VTSGGDGWSLEVFATDDGVEPFTGFLQDLDELDFAALDAALRHVLAVRGLDLAKTEWLKPLGAGLHEFRVRHSVDEIVHMFVDDLLEAAPTKRGSVLLRVFVHFHGQRVILLLAGYDKQDDSSQRRQQRAIAAARKYLTTWQEQEARRRAAERKGRSSAGRRW